MGATVGGFNAPRMFRLGLQSIGDGVCAPAESCAASKGCCAQGLKLQC